jgi:hypothetical protein
VQSADACADADASTDASTDAGHVQLRLSDGPLCGRPERHAGTRGVHRHLQCRLADTSTDASTDTGHVQL